ncbi:MAG: elongation factor G [Oscillospiraceae bacterium]|nr:elongation factor G [Oscillospiraceae bacterium]MCI7498823.1 elongation factor G [Oscillospiraceae bacterium]MDD7278753.1 elongation factor G [Oscillospiraceae bacterium]MDY2864489.1 elongation factor G [Oscillospiraceae bacterium]
MKEYRAEDIRNIAIAGHSGSGKTTLAEALIYKAGASDRLGKTAEGTTVCDYDPEEIKRKASLGASVASFEYNGLKLNILDAPGLFDFEADMLEAVRAADTVMITVSGKSGVKVGTEKAYKAARKAGKATMFVITKVDDPDANFYNVLTDLKTVFGPTVCPVIVPVIKDRQVVSYVNLIEMKCYKYDGNGNVSETDMPTAEISEKMEYRMEGLVAAFSEAVAETDDALMEKFFEGEAFTQKELVKGLHDGMNRGLITPVVCCSDVTMGCIDMLLKEVTLLMPSPADCPPAEAVSGDDIEEISCTGDAPLRAFVFKTVADQFVGKMSFIRVMSGVLKANSEYINASTGGVEKIGKLYTLCGKKQTEVTSVGAGDICAAVKIGAATNDTICEGKAVSLDKIVFPRPCYKMAVRPKSQGDESKISAAFARLCEEDPTLSFGQDSATGEFVLAGLGEQHLEVAAAKLKNKFGVEVTLAPVRIAYKETIRKKVKTEGKHKKQSGGHGQYGHVWIEFEPCLSDDLVFEEKVFGGAVPRNFFPAVEKGLRDCMGKGVLAGCPVTGVKAILVDGSYHPVDSSEMAFKTAAAIAFKEGMKQADPTILEPVGTLRAIIPNDNTGDVMGDLNKRRGRVLGMNPADEKGMTEIVAEVPEREMQSFAMQLRQITRGRGSFEFDFVRYEQLPANLVSDVILSLGGAD